MDDIPSITTKRILNYVDQRSFTLGQQCVADGAIAHTLREGNTIKATCQGTAPRPYRVWVTFDRHGIDESDCSCPVGSGACKHVAALLIAFQQTPEAFTQTLPIEDKLTKLDKPQLLALIKQLLRRDPDLEQIIDAMPLPGQPITPKLFEKQADAIFATSTGEWGEAADLTKQVIDIAEAADQFQKVQDFVSAGAVYRGILASLIHHHNEFEYQDENGEFFDSIARCIDGLRSCLSTMKDEQQRLPLFRSLMDILEFDGELGGVGIGDEAHAIVLEDSTAQERREIARWIGADPQSNDFVMELLAKDAPDDEYLDFCRQQDRHYDLIDRLLKRKRLDEAARELASAPEAELPALAELFVSCQQGELAERSLRDRANRSKSPAILQWLKDRCMRRRDYGAALELARRQFQLELSQENYRQLRTIGQKLSQWETIRPELMTLLRKSADSSTFIAICLDEKLIDEALATLRAHAPQSFPDDRLAVAKAAESSRPESAIEIYLGEASTHISHRHRDAYRQACDYLKLARKLYQKSGQHSEWTRQLRSLRVRHKTLKAFLQELQKLE